MGADDIFSNCLMYLCLVSSAKGIEFSDLDYVVRKTEATLFAGGMQSFTLGLRLLQPLEELQSTAKPTEVLSPKHLSK